MKVQIQDLGIIKSAEIDLDKDIIMLCGPNNTGKTYVAYSIYGFLKSELMLPVEAINLSQSISMIFDNGAIEIDLFKLIEEYKEKILTSVASNYQKSLPAIFAADEKEPFVNTKFELILDDVETLKENILESAFEHKVFTQEQSGFIFTKPRNSHVLTGVLISDRQVTKPKERNLSIPKEVLIHVLIQNISNIFFRFLFPGVYIAPSERNAINIFSKELSLKRDFLVDQLLEFKHQLKPEDPFDFVARRASRYPLPIRDSLKIAEDLESLKANKSEFAYIADEIEKTLLRGKISISKDGSVLFKPNRRKSPQMAIHLTASVVKSLSHLVFYFRHLAKKKDFIIIDEPELNLHPDHQVIIAKLLSKIINKGFKVMISTHSDYIIREFNNLIMLSAGTQKAKELMKKYNYGKDEVLLPKQVGVYVFDYDKRTAKPLDVRAAGFEIQSIDAAIHRQNQAAQEIYFSLHE
ncbi:MAG: AAA family ATPase [Candidatus Omnitrophica bacterium]|nr:AAA family ATPase [Candidatus Omnitrophota bacterium]